MVNLILFVSICMGKSIIGMQRGGAQWLSGRVLDLRLRSCGFELHQRHWVVSFSKTLYPLLNTDSVQEDLSDRTEKMLTGM